MCANLSSGDPQLHTHMAGLGMAKTADGRVSAPDGDALHLTSRDRVHRSSDLI
jgi:hypothetical protein